MNAFARGKRRFDRWVYRRLYAFYHAVFPTSVSGARLRPDAVRRLLVARTDRVGDMVVFSPALDYLRRTLPHAEIDLLVSRANASLLAGDARVTHAYVYEPGVRGWLRAVRMLRARRYDAVITVRLRDHLFEGIFAALVAGRSGARVSVRRPMQYAGLFTHLVRVPHSRRHIRDRLLYLVRAAVGGDALAPSDDARRGTAPLVADAAAERRADALVAAWGGGPFVAFNAWGSDPRRCFGVPRAAEIAARLVERHPELVVVLTPPPKAAADAEAIVRAAGTPRVVTAPISTNLHDLVAVIRRAAAVITPDTANVHIASAVGAPLLAVFTAVTDVNVWGPWGARQRMLHIRSERPLAEMPADDLLAEFDAFYGELRADASSPARAAR